MSFLKYPIMVGWSITNKCNLKCLYCSQNSGNEIDNELDFDEVKKIIDELEMNKVSVIAFTGGEPFLREDLPDILRYANSKNIRCQITTNGLAIAEGYPLEVLSRFIKIRISLDSFNSGTHDYLRNKKGCHKKVLKAIEIVKKVGIPIEIVTTISKKNIKEIDNIFEFIKSLEVDQWSVSTFCPIGRGNDISNWLLSSEEYKYMTNKLWRLKKETELLIKTDIPQLVLLDENRRKQKNNIYCAAGTDLLVIFPNGDLAPCFSMPLIAGNTRKNSIFDIWNNSQLFQDIRNKSLLEGKCASDACEYTNVCGGCRAMAYAKYDNFLTTDPLCWKE